MKKTVFCFLIGYLAIVFLFISCSNDQIGYNNRPIQIAFSPSMDSIHIRKNATHLIDFLHATTGYSFIIYIPKDNQRMIEDMGNGKIDVALMNSSSYIIAKTKYGVIAQLSSLRNGAKVYQGEIITRVGNGINSLQDLNGRSMAYTDLNSTSGYIYPSKMLAEQKIILGKTVFLKQHDLVIQSVYNGKTDAGATFYAPPSPNGQEHDARSRLQDQYKDIMKKIKIIAVTASIPNDPLVFRKEIENNMMLKISNAFIAFSKLKLGETVFKNVYNINGFVKINERDYEILSENMSKIKK